MYPNNMYTAYFLLKECRPRKFSWKFAVVKDIQALNTVRSLVYSDVVIIIIQIYVACDGDT